MQKFRIVKSFFLLFSPLILFFLNSLVFGQELNSSSGTVTQTSGKNVKDEAVDATVVNEETDADEEETPEVVFEKLLSFEKYAPAFKVKLRKESQLESYPCMDCHEDEETNLEIRELEEEHDELTLEHGGERFWCLTCHQPGNRDYLRSLKNNAIDFDQSYRLCGQCHFQRQKDWFFGAHGKRVGNWMGERKLYLCTECHDPHSPSIKPIKPNPPPKVRKGLVFVPNGTHLKAKVWEKHLLDQTENKND
ncbi:uncharacterized protein METZ01_LOCUS43102 [marine metagenome]|uniref:Uncharacterized protein n=1 Tax=marine metagenome TaxID=408172 RepID=A0A381RH33_9ZZZZ